MRRIALFLILAISLSSCKEIASNTLKNILKNKSQDAITEDNFKTVKIDSFSTLSIPKHMREMKSLNDEASLQYANIYKELYTIVLVEEADEFVTTFKEYGDYNDNESIIENYKTVQQNMFSEAMKMDNLHQYGLMEINGFPARQISFNSSVDGINAYYLLTFVNANERVYMNMSWTLYNRKDKYNNLLETMNSSFESVNKKEDSDEI